MTGFNSTEGAGMMPFFVPQIGTTGIDKNTAAMIFSKFSGRKFEDCSAALDRAVDIYDFDEKDPQRFGKLMLDYYRDDTFAGDFYNVSDWFLCSFRRL